MSLVCADEAKEFAGIERLIKQLIPRQILEGFAPVNPLADSKLNAKPYKPKKPKAPRVGHRDGQRPANHAGKPATNRVK